MEISSKTRNIRSCFLECLYEIPNFQRPYSWGNDQLEDYWNDVALGGSDFFFGTTVTWVSAKRELFRNTFSLIDGQQRITTSAIALSVIRDFFSQIEKGLDLTEGAEHKQAVREQVSTTQNYLVAKDDDSKEYAVLSHTEEKFWEVIQKPGSIPSGVDWGSNGFLVGAARSFFEERIQHQLIEDDATDTKVEKLKALRNNILQARVIQVELSSEEDAFLIFETLNTRGADLLLSDLVKNMLVRGISEDPTDRVAVTKRWLTVVDDVTAKGINSDAMNRFIWQSWNSRRDAVKEPELYKQLKVLVNNTQLTHAEYLAELEFDSRVYTNLEADYKQFPPKMSRVRNALSIPEVQDAINGLNIFKVTVANSAIIALVRKFDNTNLITERQVKRTIRAIESFHFQFNAMANSGSTGGTRGRYNRFSVSLEKASTKVEVTAAIDDFVARLRGSLPSRNTVVDAFSGLAYAPKLKLTNAQRNSGSTDLIRYILVTIAQRMGQLPPAQHASNWTIEHIAPQSTATSSFEDPLYSIGNLTLLSEQANSSLGDEAFRKKKSVLKRSAVPKDATLESWTRKAAGFEPNANDVVKRAKALAELAVTETWKIL
ncbi:DUF262 domain-containing protein [Rhodococcus sp. SORGH_AS_0303]|uniref:DUF262 domain-containing protein n=1 Tax=Rhodococcus sp. SORGH_AS_0303 TaxID=3041753 RepID=UPI002789A6C4|nr:DUF262 domain-containing HNH endonuclease family protein [Rhodococcus sp. SORGH_AS_0303]MDQ1201977.1 hypothetical protein [Rhodococcus sp. SORGH_AS_0303]